MKIAYTGHRYIKDRDIVILERRIVHDVRDPDVDEMFFGGAIGIDSHSLRFADRAREGRRTPVLTLVCPDTLENLPLLARHWAGYADRFVELKNPIRAEDGWLAFKLRNRYMIDQIVECGQLTAFWSGRRRGGTWDAIEYAREVDACWEHVQIEGEERPR